MIEAFLISAAAGAAMWYGIYRLHMHLKNERWAHGLEEMPDKDKLIPKHVISYLIVQVLWALFLIALSNFPAQR